MQIFGALQTLLDRYNRQKQEGLTWLLCFLYSLPSMHTEGYCTPSNSTLAISGEKPRDVSTIKRYLAALITLGLLERYFPNGRTHVLEATELGQKLFDSRKQNPALLKAQKKVAPLNKTNLVYINNTTTVYPDSYKGTTKKPMLEKINVIILRNMLKKCTKSFEEAERLEGEILFSILQGRLMCIAGTGTYHLIPNAICIALWLVKQGRWKTPNSYSEIENVEKIVNEESKMLKISENVCYKCKNNSNGIKKFELNDGAQWICAECYLRNWLYIEQNNVKTILISALKREFCELHGESEIDTFCEQMCISVPDSKCTPIKILAKDGILKYVKDNERAFTYRTLQTVVSAYYMYHRPEAKV